MILLIINGADLTIRGNKDNKTPFELAIQWNYDDIANLLKKCKGKQDISLQYSFCLDLLQWLNNIDLQDIFSILAREEVFLEECESLTEPILERMGINAGKRMRLLKSIKLLGN